MVEIARGTTAVDAKPGNALRFEYLSLMKNIFFVRGPLASSVSEEASSIILSSTFVKLIQCLVDPK
jgi:hypothetical protein